MRASPVQTALEGGECQCLREMRQDGMTEGLVAVATSGPVVGDLLA